MRPHSYSTNQVTRTDANTKMIVKCKRILSVKHMHHSFTQKNFL
ncbi:hypothetical protein B4096_0592 [Heyndrickxia coagulans]|nr:hypothetical protein B4096_0592 [Heyndrickxia coagulans]